MTTIEVNALPKPISLDLSKTALLMIDMQRDFLEPGGFGESLGNDVAQLRHCIDPCIALLNWARGWAGSRGLRVIHTREGHRSDLSDLHPQKQARCAEGRRIGDPGPMGRIMIRGEAGQDIIPELYPAGNETLIDKPGKGAFFATDLELLLRSNEIRSLIICGVTTEVCVHTTVREANDRGYEVVVPGDCCGSYFPEFHRIGLEMICAQGGIFGHVCQSEALTTHGIQEQV